MLVLNAVVLMCLLATMATVTQTVLEINLCRHRGYYYNRYSSVHVISMEIRQL